MQQKLLDWKMFRLSSSAIYQRLTTQPLSELLQHAKVESSRTSLASRTHFEALASKPTGPRKCPVLGLRTGLFFDWFKRKITKQKLTKISSLSIHFFSLFEK